MNAKNALIAIVIALAAAGGYWLGQRGVAKEQAAPTAKVGERKLLYYRNPMGLPDTSPVPKKDPMGMDYIPVYEGEEPAPSQAAGGVRISPDRVQKLGVKTEAAAKRTLDQVVRAAGRVQIDERRIHTVAPKFEGWVDRLYVNATGQPVGQRQPLFDVYSPDLVSAQREYALAAKGAANVTDAETKKAMDQVAEAALLRLRNWDISAEQVKALAAGEDAKRTLTFRSPVSGVVIDKKAVQGMRFAPGDALYQVADLSSVWVIADVPEQDVGQVATGARAKLTLAAYPGKTFEGRVTFIYPTLNAETRTVPVRIELANPGGQLKPAMYAQAELAVPGRGVVLTVRQSAVIDSGTRQIVFVQTGEGRFAPRQVKLGARDDTYVEVLDGIAEGESVVTAANFLIDAESNLQSALGIMGGTGEKRAVAPAAPVGHQGTGTLDAIDTAAGTVTISHQTIPDLKWPAMTMDFKLANPALVTGIKPGTPIGFEFVERGPGEWVVTKVEAKER